MVGSNPSSNKLSDPARSTQRPKRAALDPRSTAELKRMQARNRTRNTLANLVTVLMLLLTLAIMAWVAYQLNYPIALNLSRLFQH
jgi:hypothetical protein